MPTPPKSITLSALYGELKLIGRSRLKHLAMPIAISEYPEKSKYNKVNERVPAQASKTVDY